MVPTVQNPEHAIDPRAKAAYLARRCSQIVLDAALLWLVCMVQLPLTLAIALPLFEFGVPLPTALVVGFAILFALVLAENWWWHVWFPYRHGGSTILMRWLKLRVIGLDGEPAWLAQHNARWLLVSADALFFGLVGLVLMIVTPQHQRLGDIVARTHVVRIPAAPSEVEWSESARDEAATPSESAGSGGVPAEPVRADGVPSESAQSGEAAAGHSRAGGIRNDPAADPTRADLRAPLS